ncbi:MAG: glycoside hydrolase family 1 protein [Anaerolineae bacterium]|nr:glycoside hydrolase family 1 protein [Anaerolineae bacterium]
MVDFTMQFPPGFLWGAATAAHQVEGGNTNNQWHAWEEAGRVYRQQRAGTACDWWGGRYAEDFDHAAAMRHNAHRFSIEWSRIEPEPGTFDESALDHYVQVLDALRQRHMEPLVTLHHFTNPLWLQERGGWANPDVVQYFEEFVRFVVDALGDRVTMWCTINEPMVYATQSHLFGHFPPGGQSLGQAFRVAENMLRGHAAAYHAIKELHPAAQVGFAKHQISLTTRRPALLHGPARNLIGGVFNRAWVEALMTGTLRFPLRKIDVPQARDTLDWIGLNYYYRFLVGFHPRYPRRLFLQQTQPPDGIQGPDSVGEIWPEGLFEHIRWLCERTSKPLYVTENGVPDPDDALRPLHLVRSLRSVWQAINFNYPVKGYFHWTLADNFEWSEGYAPRFRFGLYACDPETQQRTKRRSADLYGEVCAANALTSDIARRYLPHDFEQLFPGVDVQEKVDLHSPHS